MSVISARHGDCILVSEACKTEGRKTEVGRASKNKTIN